MRGAAAAGKRSTTSIQVKQLCVKNTQRYSSRVLVVDTKKYRTQHAGFSEERAGEWVSSKDGLRRTFKCAGCIQNEKGRAHKMATQYEHAHSA